MDNRYLIECAIRRAVAEGWGHILLNGETELADAALAAIADTHPQGGDVKQAPLVSGGGSEGNRPDTVTNARDGTE